LWNEEQKMGEKERKIKAIWFSPTGTTQVTVEVLAQSICKNLGEDTVFKSKSFTLPQERNRALEFSILGP